MSTLNLRFIHYVYATIIVIADLLVFLILGILLMSYDDNYNSAKGEYWSLASMNRIEQLIYLAFHSWVILNIFALGYLGYQIYRLRAKQRI
jgi:hypothetical protein